MLYKANIFEILSVITLWGRSLSNIQLNSSQQIDGDGSCCITHLLHTLCSAILSKINNTNTLFHACQPVCVVQEETKQLGGETQRERPGSNARLLVCKQHHQSGPRQLNIWLGAGVGVWWAREERGEGGGYELDRGLISLQQCINCFQ